MSSQIEGRYFGTRGPLFRLYFLTAFLTLITLGIYRFWAKTRIRNYIWSATSGDGDSFEYTGTGLEKFFGFLVAIVILAVYLGIVQMALFYFGLNLFTEPTNQAQALAQIGAIYVTLLAVLPLFLFARYRARRYKMARSRWRGIRFGMDNGACGYVARAMGYYVLNILTIGLLNPLVTFRLEKYMTDRSWYGAAPFEQRGHWQDLYGGMKHVLIGLAIILFGGALAYAMGSAVLGAMTAVVGYTWFLIGLIFYRVFAFNYLTRHKVLDGQVKFDATLNTGRIVSILVFGTIAIGILLVVIFAVIGAVFASSMEVFVGGGLSQPGAAPSFVSVVVNAVLYVAALMVAGGLNLVMITQPVIEAAVNSVVIRSADHLETLRQRTADDGADAEGFADALDVGGAL